MLQLVFGIFCIVFGGTVVFMKKDQLLDILLMGRRFDYEDQLYRMDKFVVVIRILCGIVALLGIYICVGSVIHIIVNGMGQ